MSSSSSVEESSSSLDEKKKKKESSNNSDDDSSSSNSSSSVLTDQVLLWRQQAEQMRLQAEAMEMTLTLEKIAVLEQKLEKIKHQQPPAVKQQQPQQTVADMKRELEQLRRRLNTATSTTDNHQSSSSSSDTTTTAASAMAANGASSVSSSLSAATSSSSSSDSSDTTAAQAAAAAAAAAEQRGVPLAGFDAADLELYIPVAWQIEQRLPSNSTMAVKMQAFRTDPALQEHFSQKITALLLQPLQDVQRLEELRRDYLNSASRTEKRQIKRELEQLERTVQQSAPAVVTYRDDLFQNVPPLTNLDERVAAISRLPPILQAIYLSRNQLEYPETTTNATTSAAISREYQETLQLAIQLDYYDEQLQVLEQVPMVLPLTNDMQRQLVQSLDSLPVAVRRHLASELTESQQEQEQPQKQDVDTQVLVDLICQPPNTTTAEEAERKWRDIRPGSSTSSSKSAFPGPGITVTIEGGGGTGGGSFLDGLLQGDNADDEAYQDIEFLDRSRYIAELHPALARMEGQHPTEEEMQAFVSQLLRGEVVVPDNKSIRTATTRTSRTATTFMVSSKPERVLGGYYIRGQNVIPNDATSGIQLTKRLQERLVAFNQNATAVSSSSSMQSLSPQRGSRGVVEHPPHELEFFYLPDPEPLSDESYEMGYEDRDEPPVLFVTTKNATLLYDNATPTTKLLVSTLGLLSVWIFAVSTADMSPVLQERMDAALSLSSSDDNLYWLADIASQSLLSMVAIQLAHEAAHRFVAWKDKFEIGLPSLIPSVSLGLQGAITPLKSPPPSLKSLFDFAIAGPIAGLLASMAFLLVGLAMTASIENLNQLDELPVLPVSLLQSSALGGGLTELFLGKGVLLVQQQQQQAAMVMGEQVVAAATSSSGGNNPVLQLHPFAISGFTGLIANALALLPLGNTDGGRIALAMFGRRGTFIVKTFTALLLCMAGFFGLDNSYLLLTYVLFVSLWQRELETPARNEVEELDFVRGAVAISMALVVGLVLIPFA